MTNEDKKLNLKPNISESNKHNKYQGEFRKTILDLDLLKYSRSKIIEQSYPTTLVVTCLDHIDGQFKVTQNGGIHSFTKEKAFLLHLSMNLGIERVLASHGPTANDIKEVKLIGD